MYFLRTKIGVGSAHIYKGRGKKFSDYATDAPPPDTYNAPSFMKTDIGFRIGAGKRTDMTKEGREVENPGPGKYNTRKTLINFDKAK